MAKNKQSQPKSFEEAVGELEQILREMERGEVPLEQSLTRYERGNYLLQYCRAVLAKAEQQIEELSKTDDAPAAETPTIARPDSDPESADDDDDDAELSP